MVQLVTRIDDQLAAHLDDLVDRGEVKSRSDAVRLSLRAFIEQCHRRQVAAEIVEGYRRRPQTPGEVGWSDESTVAMIADEPW